MVITLVQYLALLIFPYALTVSLRIIVEIDCVPGEVFISVLLFLCLGS